jgi:hypothetical protein
MRLPNGRRGRAGGRRSDGGRVENGLREGRYWVVGGKYGCARLHVFTRIITRFYTRFLAINVTGADGGQRIARPTVEGGREKARKWEKVGRK